MTVEAGPEPGAEPTLLERLRRLEGGEPAAAAQGPGKEQGREAPLRLTSDSVTTVLGQALESGDKQLLEKCLTVRDTGAVDKTVRGLSPPQAALLLQACVDRIQGKAGRARDLTVWLRALLLGHTAYFMSAPGAHKALTTLSQVIEQRVAMQRPLLALSGRLDLLTSHMARARQGRLQQEGLAGQKHAPVIYDEEEEEAREAALTGHQNGASAMSISGASSEEDEEASEGEEEGGGGPGQQGGLGASDGGESEGGESSSGGEEGLEEG